MNLINFFTQNINLFLLATAALALLIGSFLNVVIHRLPQMILNEWNKECRTYLGFKDTETDTPKINLCLPQSHCPHCKKALKPWHNIPILSFFILKGKCAYCRVKISPRYPIVELLCCLSSVYIAYHFGVTLQTVAALLFTWILIAATFIDLDYHILPDSLTFSLIWLGLLFSLLPVFTNSTDAILGASIGYFIFFITQSVFQLITGKIGMGQGDYKFLAGLGAFLGWQQLPVIILLASCTGLIFGLIHMIIKRQFKSLPIPFGPYLAVAGWVSLIWGPEIIRLYLTQFYR